MFCQQCGAQIDDGLAFCTNCGARQAHTIPENNEVINEPQVQPVVNMQYIPANEQYNQPASHTGSPKRVSFGEAIKLFFVNYVNFKGRSTASEYWYAYLFNAIVAVCTSWIPVVGTIVALGLLLPGISIGVRRLHDTGKSWVCILKGLIPFAGVVLLIIQYCKASDVDNKWGPAPKN